MASKIQFSLPSACFLSGVASIALAVGPPLLDHTARAHHQAPDEKLLSALGFASMATGVAALGSGLIALLLARGRSWRVYVGVGLGVVTWGKAAYSWIDSLPPRIDVADLRTTRDRAIPAIEEVTGLKFKIPVDVRLGDSDAVRLPIEETMRHDLKQEKFRLPFDYLGLYDPIGKTISIFPDGLGHLQRMGLLVRGRSQEIARAVLVDELVHALDDQHGFLENRERLQRMAERNLNAFIIRRALEEGHSEFVGGQVCKRLGMPELETFQPYTDSSIKAEGGVEQMIADIMRFSYRDGRRFFEYLASAGRKDLALQVFTRPPLWLHQIKHPEVYVRDVGSGRDRAIQAAIARVHEIFPSPEWTLSFGASDGLSETTEGVFPESHASADDSGFESLRIAKWFGSYVSSTARGRKTSLMMWRFPDVDAAHRGLNLRERQSRQDAATGGDTSEETSTVLRRSGDFLLSVSFSGEWNQADREAIVDALVKEVLVPCGADAVSSRPDENWRRP